MSGLKIIDGTPTAMSKYLREKQTNKSEIEECEECCYVKDMTNSKPPICEYHRGFQSGLLKAKDDFIKIIDEWNYLGTAREPIYKKGKRMSFKDTNRKVYRIRIKELEELKQKTGEIK